MPMNPRLLRPLATSVAPAPPPLPADQLVLETAMTTGTFALTASNDAPTQYGVEWWDGTRSYHANFTEATKSATATPATKTIRVFRGDGSGAPAEGGFSTFSSSSPITSFNSSALPALRSCFLQDSTSALLTFTCPATHFIRVLDIGSFGGSTLNIGTVAPSSSGEALATVEFTIANAANLTAFSATFANAFEGGYGRIGRALFSNTPALASVRLINAGGMLDSGKTKKIYNADNGIVVENCNLSAAALNQLYTDLYDFIDNQLNLVNLLRVAGNPGVGTDTPAIATNKGWVVFGS